MKLTLTHLKAAALVLLFSPGCFCMEGAGQTPITDPPLQLHASQYFDSQALICSGISGVVMENDTFLAQLSGAGRLENVVHRISLDGAGVAEFNVGSFPRPTELADRTPYIWAFTSSREGDAFVLTRWLKNRVSEITNIVRFDSHGTFEEITPVALENVQVLHMARFRDGRFILIGGRNGESGFRSVEEIILDAGGKVLLRKPLRELSEAEETQAKKERMRESEEIQARMKAGAEAAKKAQASIQVIPSGEKKEDGGQKGEAKTPEVKRPDREMEMLYAHTLLITGDNGEVYLGRPDKPGKIYRVASDGEMTAIPLKRRANETTAIESGNTELVSGTVSAGHLILFYAKMDSTSNLYRPRHMQSLSIEAYSLSDGEHTATYVGDPQIIGTTPVGWNGNGASYLKHVNTAQPPGFEIVFATR